MPSHVTNTSRGYLDKDFLQILILHKFHLYLRSDPSQANQLQTIPVLTHCGLEQPYIENTLINNFHIFQGPLS